MTDVLTMNEMQNIANNTKDVSYNKLENNKKLLNIKLFLAIKRSKKLDELINQYIISDKSIRNGKKTIINTRITPLELIYSIIQYKQENPDKEDDYELMCKHIFKEYPSIDSEEKIRAALAYIFKYKINTIRYIISVLING